MVEVIEKQLEKPKEKDKQKKKFMIFGFSIWRLLAYFILYSVAGFLIETVFGLLTKGVLESRKSFLYGPFCAIYGVGAVIMIVALQKFRKNNFSLFVGGFVVGSIVEYLVSLIGEYLLHVKWWDYSSMPFNIDGRICVFFSLFWGALAIFLMTWVNPKMDHLIEKIKGKFSIKLLKTLTIAGIVFLFLDCLITGFALRMFFTRLVYEYDIELKDVASYHVDYTVFYQNDKIKDFVLKYFSDEKMLKTFPNLKVTGEDGHLIYVSDIIKDVQPYYVRIFTPKKTEGMEIFEGM